MKNKSKLFIFATTLILGLFLFGFSCVVSDSPKPPSESFFPQFSPVGGFYKSAQLVTLTCEKDGSTIYYTTDGTTPTTASTKYADPFSVNTTTVVRSVAIISGKYQYAMTCYDFDLAADVATHKASPNWQDQIIYFLMIDRFFNGNTSNDAQGCTEAESDKTLESNYSGGDMQGIIDKLVYIKNLGATTIWITPPIKNEWWEGNYGGFHGYWASDFTDVDPHVGDIAKYKELVDAAHTLGLYVIQDIVVNHLGDYFTVTNTPFEYEGTNWLLNTGTQPTSAPVQLPWSMNDPTVFTQNELENFSFYHWTPAISDFNDDSQKHDYQMSNLDDMNTDSAVVQNLLRGYFRYWIDKVDVDGYRVDTVMYVKPDFFEGFVNSTTAGNKGIREHAKDVGKDDFILFGEAWSTDDALCASYTQSSTGTPRCDSAIYFPLNFAIRDTFGSGQETSALTTVLNKRFSAGYANPNKLVTFVDNHDLARILNTSSPELVKSAYLLIMSIPGIPQIYYGTEQGFKITRRAMFTGGYKGDGTVNTADHFTESGEWYDFIKDAITLRKAQSVLRNGTLTIIRDTNSGPGIFAYKLVEDTGGIGKEAFVIFNTSSNNKVANDMSTAFTPGDEFTLQSPSINTPTDPLTILGGGKLDVVMPAKSCGIYILTTEGPEPPPVVNNITITSSYPALITTPQIIVDGTTDTPCNIRVFLDGELDSTSDIAVGSTWSVTIPLSTVSNGPHTVTAMINNIDPSADVFSAAIPFTYQRPFVSQVTVSDPEGDDTGPPTYSYTLPTHESFADHLEDITNVEVLTSGSDMRITVTMKETSDIWSPIVNNFDHVAVSIFLQKSGSTSIVDVHPRHNYTLPSGFTWDYLIFQTGWSSGMFSNASASATAYGTPISPGATTWVDHTAKTITFSITSSSLDKPTSLSGWKIYIAVWDEDMGNPRGLTLDGGVFAFGGGDALTDPLVIDETSIITIP